MSDKVQQVAKDEADRVATLSREAVASQAYLYPIKGVFYFASHRSLWKPFLSRLAPAATAGIAITATMFTLTYVPQAALMAVFEGPVAAFSTFFLVLSESSTIFNVISKSFLIPEALIDTFDGTLVARNATGIVSEGRQLTNGSDPINRLGKLIKKPFAKYTPTALIRYFIYLPLNFIPVIGTVLFLIAQGKRSGPLAHDRYFQLKGLSSAARKDHIAQRQGAYTSFGVVASLLELVPVASVLFAFTNQVGAALWAADMERETTTAPALREQTSKVK